MQLNSPDPEHERFCSVCDKPLYGRADQRYCNDQCRNQANRQRYKKEKWHEPDYIARINQILKRNHQIIERMLLQEKPRTVSRSLLIEYGFDFRFFTSKLDTATATYYFCYAYGWRALDSGKILLVENFEQADI